MIRTIFKSAGKQLKRNADGFVKRTRISVRCSGLINRPPKNPLHKPSPSQTFRPLQEVEFPHQRRRYRSFEICFAGAKMFSPFAGKERAANLAIHRPASWTGVPSMSRDQKSERRLPAKPGCS